MPILNKLREKLSLRQRFSLLLLVLALIVFIIAGFTVKDRLGLSLFNRWFTYDNEESSITFSHGSRSQNLFANLDYALLSCSDSLLQLFSPTGETLLKEPVSFASPALSSNGKQAVLFDAGGQTLDVLSKGKVVYTLNLPAGQYILSATINQNGWMAVTTKEEGYKGVVTVYNNSYDPVVSIRLSSSYLVDAVVTPDCKGVYILSPGQSAGIFESRLLYFDLDQAEEPKSQIPLGNNVVLSMKSANNRCWVLSENELFILSSGGELLNKFPFDGKYLKRGSLGGNDFAALLLSNSPSGNSGTLYTIDAEGASLGSVDLQEQVLAMSTAGRYIAILTPSSLHIYTKDLTEIHSTDHVQGVQNLVLYSDGSLALISNELVQLYVP